MNKQFAKRIKKNYLLLIAHNSMNLIIVESPVKAKTITKFLPDKYTVVSSYGHVRDLPKGELGVDTEKNFEPKYVIPTKARKKVSELKKEVKKSDSVILATDEDREGEAIAWHLIQALGLKQSNVKGHKSNVGVSRIVFHEITKSAIEKALKNPRELNMGLVDAQQARRILDRLVGYKLSPFLWKKIVRGLSAGRVQSVALRLIVEREREIEAFKPDEYWSIEALFRPKNTKEQAADFVANLHSKDGKTLNKLEIKNKKESDTIIKELANAKYTIKNIEQKEHKKNPLPPFTTSTLQQTAWGKLGYSAKRTMMLAQNLYERGLITYHRTDSLSLAPSAVSEARSYIKNQLGTKYLPQTPKFYKTKSKGAQEAHEAIRPTDPSRIPDKLKLEGPQKRLYTLIWQRFIASQITPAIYAATTIDIGVVPLHEKSDPASSQYVFRANGQIMRFDGFTKIYPTKSKEEQLPQLEKKDPLDLRNLEGIQHFTKPPARYNEASLVKILEKHGIGRPSTYAGIISTIQDRNYVQRNDQKQLEPNEIGFLVNDLLVEHFPAIVDIDFTAKMERKLDDIAEGKEEWKKVIEEFYRPFEKRLEKKYDEVKKIDTDKKTGKTCPECGKELMEKMGRFGQFLACSGFPECRHTESLDKNKPKDLGVHCPKCVAGNVIEKKTRRGKIFYGCSKYPDCDFATWDKPHIEDIVGTIKKRVAKCPKCEKVLVEKNTKRYGDQILCSNKECPDSKSRATKR